MRYELIATLGPATREAQTWQALMGAGVSTFRLNTSHLTVNEVQDWLDELGKACAGMQLVLDLQGSKWRLGSLTPFTLVEGQLVVLAFGKQTLQVGVLSVPHRDFFMAAERSNGEIILNDARQRLQIERLGTEEITARVTLGGEILPHKGITLADTDFRSEGLSEKDEIIVRAAQHIQGIRFAVSYIKDAEEMQAYRARIGSQTYLIAKLERGKAMKEAAQIARSADELWVCRGDLGAELGLSGMAMAVSQLSSQIGNLSVPVMMAGQVLEHMSEHPTPTRAEICNLHDVLQQGYAGVVLSDETAVGKYPLPAVQAAGMFLN